MAVRKEPFFWASYSDLMTSLFLIMLVIFVLVIVLLQKNKSALEVTIIDLERTNSDLERTKTIVDSLYVVEKSKREALEQVINSTKDLAGGYFVFNEDHEKFVLNIKCWFPKDVDTIESLDEETRRKLRDAGQQIKRFLIGHSNNQYLVIVEGQASKDSPLLRRHNYELSYRRALSLLYFWSIQSGVIFPPNCELQIAGSGDGTLNATSMREDDEPKNQRFLIYVIPKNIIKSDE